MSAGKIHASVTAGASFGIACGYAASYFFLDYQIPFVVAGTLTQILVHPDWDVDNGDISHFLIRNNLGRSAEKIWDIWNKPYALAIEHRSFLSHAPVFGTFLRLIYCCFPIIIAFIPSKKWKEAFFLSFLSQIISLPIVAIVAYTFAWWWFTPFFVGMCVGDTLHLIFDIK